MPITKNSQETQELGRKLAKKVKIGQVICLSGELGSGKTTFTQGFLEGLGASGPYTSPTFVIMKQYHIAHNIKHGTKKKNLLHDVYHIDAYRVNASDIINLGWEEITQDKNSIVLVEWAERIKKIIPVDALWIKFKWLSENERDIIYE